MRALFLAGGFGTRLGTFGEQTPKGLIQMGQTTILGKILVDVMHLTDAVSDIAVVTNGRFQETYGRWLLDKGYAERVKFLSDGVMEPDKRLGAIGDLRLALDTFSWYDQDLLVLPSDTTYEFPLKEFVEFSKRQGTFATVVRRMEPAQIAGRLGCAVLDAGYIVEFVEKPANPPSPYAAIPFYFYPKSVLARLGEYQQSGGNMDAPGSIIPWLLAQGVRVAAYETMGVTLDVGTMDDVARLQGT